MSTPPRRAQKLKSAAARINKRASGIALGWVKYRELARALYDNGLVDLEWYSAMTGKSFASERKAARHFVQSSSHIPPHPILLAGRSVKPAEYRKCIASQLGIGEVIDAKAARLSNPAFDPVVYNALCPESAEWPGGAFAHWVAFAELDHDMPVEPEFSRYRPTVAQWWENIRRAQSEVSGGALNSEEGSSGDADVGENDAPRQPGLASVVLYTDDGAWASSKSLRSLITTEPGANSELEVVLVEDSESKVATRVSALYGAFTCVNVIPRREEETAVQSLNRGFQRTSGTYVTFLRKGVSVGTGWYAPVAGVFDDDPKCVAVNPVLMHDDGTVANAGFGFTANATTPTAIARGLPLADVEKLGASFEVPAVGADMLTVRAADFATMGGFSAKYERSCHALDLCRRGNEEGGTWWVSTASLAILKRSASDDDDHGDTNNDWSQFAANVLPDDGDRLASIYHEMGFDVSRWDTGTEPATTLVRRQELVTEGPFEGLPVLRWAIKTPAPATPRARVWGDLYFAQDLGAALRSLGQDVVVDFRQGAYRESVEHDDVSLVIRGPVKFEPIAGQTNVMWNISAPNRVTPQELDGFDLVYAASDSWASAYSEKSGTEIRPLLQAIDPERFNPETASDRFSRTPVFVGSTYFPRLLPLEFVKAGVPIDIYGPDWDHKVDPKFLAGGFFPNDQLGELYASSSLVVCDHYPHMKQNGFISNRVFESVACGTPVVVDDVVGGFALFGQAVAVAQDSDDVKGLVDDQGLAKWVSSAEMAVKSQYIRDEHSFIKRAELILRDVYSYRGDL